MRLQNSGKREETMEKDMKNNAPDDFTDVFDDSDDAVIDDILEEAKYYSVPRIKRLRPQLQVRWI